MFAIGTHPVTNEQFARFRAAHGPRDATPLRGVTWADAVAYCRWLTTSTSRIYRLPDEREWEKAARGTKGRHWPWGDAEDPTRANTRESGLRRTSPVGAYAAGASPEGVCDLIGNVREWTNTWADGRVLRGGSYLDAMREAIPSRRMRAVEDLRGHGFRLVRGMTGR